ncbi:MAG: hypothetical protein JWM36_1021 [Hyphomicrobiales bacterium]|nr:hypothetical protein [Hyphomicrobiales bacterium]
MWATVFGASAANVAYNQRIASHPAAQTATVKAGGRFRTSCERKRRRLPGRHGCLKAP